MSEPTIQIACVDALYVHMMTFAKAGDFNQGHSHTYDHVTLLARGRVRVESNGRESIFEAPKLIVIPKGVQHRITALEERTLVCCLHALHSRDNPSEIIDPSMVPAGTPPWKFAVPMIEEHARKEGVA